MTKDWRIEQGGEDYFRNQKKTSDLADRRPAIRNAVDLGLGPGIGQNTTRIDDYNDLLATFNGYYSSAPGAGGAPNTTEAFVGYVLSDSEFGGRQVFTGLTSNVEYRRTFTRNPIDPEVLGWGAWSGQRIPATATSVSANVLTEVNSGVTTPLLTPTLTRVGPDIFDTTGTDSGIIVRQQGVYSGVIEIGVSNTTAVTFSISRPSGLTTISEARVISQPANFPVLIPFVAVASDTSQGFTVTAVQSSGSTVTAWWRFSATRVGDAV